MSFKGRPKAQTLSWSRESWGFWTAEIPNPLPAAPWMWPECSGFQLCLWSGQGGLPDPLPPLSTASPEPARQRACALPVSLPPVQACSETTIWLFRQGSLVLCRQRRSLPLPRPCKDWARHSRKRTCRPLSTICKACPSPMMEVLHCNNRQHSVRTYKKRQQRHPLPCSKHPQGALP